MARSVWSAKDIKWRKPAAPKWPPLRLTDPAPQFADASAISMPAPAKPKMRPDTDGYHAWPDEQVAVLIELFAAGVSMTLIASQLAIKFQGTSFTRNMVIGKVTRLKLTRPPIKTGHNLSSTVIKARAARERAVQPPAPVVAPPPPPPPPPPPAPIDPEPVSGAPILIWDLRDHHCRWPVHRGEDGWQFCGRHREANVKGLTRSYCASHGRKAVQGRVRA